jgi:hypothetical protein
MKMGYLYLALAVVGAVLPLSQFIPASMAGEFSISGMMEQLTATRTVTGFTFDLTVAALAGIVFIIAEGIRRGVRHYWIALVGTVLIGFSFGLPFFLFLRERQDRRNAAAEHER